jgi:hypothetical protein
MKCGRHIQKVFTNILVAGVVKLIMRFSGKFTMPLECIIEVPRVR